MRMPVPAAVLAAALTLALGGLVTADRALAQNAKPGAAKQPVKTAAQPARTAGVPADVRARVVAKLHGASPNDVAATPIPGLYEVTMSGLVAYVSEDGKYLFSGNLYDLDSQVNLTAARRNSARAAALAAVREDQMIVFSPTYPKMTVTVFTDIDCGFCRKFHSHIAELNKAGVKVRYMLYPRTGPGTESWRKAESVWCAADRKDALTRAKKGEPVKSKACGDAVVKAQYELGSDIGVEGTPAIFAQNGDYIGGYLSPEDLVAAVQDAQKAADRGTAAPAGAR
jgi:thiol:disulfide interchange protein DsbC